MAVPDFVAALRAQVGHAPLWLPGVSAVVVDDTKRILLGQRADTGRWALIGGIVDPGEEPADAVAREVAEETAVEVVVERLVRVRAEPEVRYPNGDRARYLLLEFACRAIGGTARVNDDESLAVGWFELDALPPLPEQHRTAIRLALAGGPETVFRTA